MGIRVFVHPMYLHMYQLCNFSVKKALTKKKGFQPGQSPAISLGNSEPSLQFCSVQVKSKRYLLYLLCFISGIWFLLLSALRIPPL